MGMTGIGLFGRRRRSEHAPHTQGDTLHAALWYDLVAYVATGGRERALRRSALDLAGIEPGCSLLDVGCGTGTFAILAKERVGESGKVAGIDASPEMIARARSKARRRRVDVDLRNAALEELPFADGAFDVVTATLVLHHLPDDARRRALREVRRVLRPGGRLFVVEFGAERRGHGLGRLVHRRHVHCDVRAVVDDVREAGLFDVGHGALGFRGLQFVRARAPDVV